MSNLTGQALGRYHILEQLGEGGMATVYKAYDTRLERDVAVKVIRVDQFAPAVLERILKRFEREAKSLARLTHPNIVHINDYGEQDGIPYLVMDYLPGGTLKQRLGKPMPWHEAVRLLIPVANALEYAHEHKVVHRDVKPANILLTEKGQPMLTDFGIAKLLEAEDGQTLTGTGMGVGTPEYMAPEQGLGKEVDGRADIYSLGIIFYELITGRKPYTSDTPMAVIIKQVSDPLPRPRQFVPDLPEAVERVLFKALAKDAQERYPDAGAFAVALENLVGIAASAQPARAIYDSSATLDTFETIQQPQTEFVLRQTSAPISSASPAMPRITAPKPARRTGNLVLWIGLGVAGIVLVSALIGWLAGGGTTMVFPTNTQVFTPTAAVTKTPVATETPPVTHTPAPTITPAATQTPLPTPTLAIGETRVSEKDGMVMVSLGGYLVDQTAVTNAMFESFVLNTGYETEVEKINSGYVHTTALVCPTWTICEPGVIGKDTRYSVYKWKKANVSWRSWNSDGQKYVVQISWTDAENYCKWAGRRLLTEQEFNVNSRMVKGSALFEWVHEKNIVPSSDKYPEIRATDYSLDMLTFRCALTIP